MLHNHSPEKENRSPATRKQKQKEIKTPLELAQFLASAHCLLSPDLQAALTQPVLNEIRLIPSSPRDEEKVQLRVQLADLQFELKKVSEDFAQFKLLSKMDKDKTVRRIREELEEQRTKNSEESSKWEKKFVERSQQYEQECEHFRTHLEKFMQAQENERVIRIEQQYNRTINKLKSQLEAALAYNRKQLGSVEEAHRSKVEGLKKHYEHEIVALRRNEEAKVKKKEEEMVQKLLMLEKEKKAEIKVIEESKKESCKVQQKYLFQIGLSERERRKLQEKVNELQMKVKVYSKRLEDQTKASEQLRIEHEQALSRVEKEKEEAVELAEELLSREKSSFLREQYSRTEQLEQRMQRLAESKEQVEGNYEVLLRSLEQRFERRESKREDVEALREFQEKLVSKQRENSHIYHQLRLVRLEKQNDEKLYTKIFSSAKKDKKSLSTRPEYDINALLRHSRTTDFRQLLKTSQK